MNAEEYIQSIVLKKTTKERCKSPSMYVIERLEMHRDTKPPSNQVINRTMAPKININEESDLEEETLMVKELEQII
ncbi:hypothetical protein CWI38_0594p0040 [Hamiltosporidium tvaerminnensis]|uniref:Uncharacterized protein n=1 Tax=Hamiltosporidium tvaerminnensis TaxID=1176355 RepID=A0A4Q9LYN5_9MICR|nr:hypothetical protein CWI38_0594p0040 [Hamiltosporidium tvaerminnensis]